MGRKTKKIKPFLVLFWSFQKKLNLDIKKKEIFIALNWPELDDCTYNILMIIFSVRNPKKRAILVLQVGKVPLGIWHGILFSCLLSWCSLRLLFFLTILHEKTVACFFVTVIISFNSIALYFVSSTKIQEKNV